MARRPRVVNGMSTAELAVRLHARGSDSEEEIARRMAGAQDEMSHAPEFHHVLVNNDFATAVNEARAVLHAARLRTARLSGLDAFLADLRGTP